MGICIQCKGRGWCGKTCPIYDRLNNLRTTVERIAGNEFSGASPPSIFVGRHGYPKVRMGVLVPPIGGDTRYLDSPELWFLERRQIEEVISYRNRLINNQFTADVRVRNTFLEAAQEVAMSVKPVDTEVSLAKKPSYRIRFDMASPPLGPSAVLKRIRIAENPKVPKKVDYIVSDTDAKATDGIRELYGKVDLNDISRLLSAGLLGLKRDRRLVPTRWSITAVDDALGKLLRDKVLLHGQIDKYRLFFSEYVGNAFAVLMVPRAFSFELFEIYRKGSVWTWDGGGVVQDYESVFGRRTYASATAGAYYAAKMAVLEYLNSIKRQASVLVIRLIGSAYYAPLGVWVIRETVREALAGNFREFESLNDALTRIKDEFKLEDKLLSKSKLLKNIRTQKTLGEF